MAVNISFGTTISFGVFDVNGVRLFWSGPVPPAGAHAVLVAGQLAPSTIYYAGWSSSGSPTINRAGLPALPNAGLIAKAAPGGIIPDRFDPSRISPHFDPFLGLSITLYYYGVPSAQSDAVRVVSPNGGEHFFANDFMKIDWQTNLELAGSALKFELHDGDGFVQFLGTDWNPTGIGSKTLYLPLLESRADYKIVAISAYDPNYFDSSDAPFTISGNLILLLSPNGGESWETAQTRSIHWKINTIFAGSGVRFELRTPRGKVMDLGSDADPDGEGDFQVTVPSVPQENDFRIRVVSALDDSVWDESDQPFSIVNPGSLAMTEKSWTLYR